MSQVKMKTGFSEMKSLTLSKIHNYIKYWKNKQLHKIIKTMCLLSILGHYVYCLNIPLAVGHGFHFCWLSTVPPITTLTFYCGQIAFVFWVKLFVPLNPISISVWRRLGWHRTSWDLPGHSHFNKNPQIKKGGTEWFDRVIMYQNIC